MKRRLTWIAVMAVLLATLLCLTAGASAEGATSGTCGDNLTWTLDENGLLTISGTGEMADYTWTERAPWDANRELINKIAVEDGVTVIGAYAFCESVNLTEVILPESVSEIRSSAFDSCSGLTEIDLPDGIDCIADHLFGRCTSLANLIIPQQVTSIEAGAFIKCTSLTEIAIPDSVQDIDISAFADCTGLTEIVLPEDLTQIREWVFAGCSGLASVTIPSSVTYIGSGAFKECSQLTDVYYPGTIDQWNAIGIDPEDNSALINANVHCIRNILTLPADLSTIESEAFANLNEADAVRIPDGEISIADDAFDADVVIIAPAGSRAIDWAIEHDRDYIEE